MNQWTVPLEWNGGMEYWNDPYSPCYFFPEAVLGVCNGSESLRSSKFILAVCQYNKTNLKLCREGSS